MLKGGRWDFKWFQICPSKFAKANVLPLIMIKQTTLCAFKEL